MRLKEQSGKSDILADKGVVIVGSIYVHGKQVSGEYTIPDNVKVVAAEAFKDNKKYNKSYYSRRY